MRWCCLGSAVARVPLRVWITVDSIRGLRARMFGRRNHPPGRLRGTQVNNGVIRFSKNLLGFAVESLDMDLSRLAIWGSKNVDRQDTSPGATSSHFLFAERRND